MRITKMATTLIVGFSLTLCAGTISEAKTDSTNPYRTPDNITPDGLPAIGYRYANLVGHEQRSLRQSFKLPMEALAFANSTSDLLSAAIIQPLPNPNQPFLPVSTTDEAGDPFAGNSVEADETTRNALGALGRLFAQEEVLRGNDASDSSPEYTPSATSPVTATSAPMESEDPFADASASSKSTETADPFGSDEGDDFGDDPFGGF